MFSAASFDYLALEGFARSPSAVQGSLDMLIAEMDEAQIESGVVMGRQSPPPFGHIRNEELLSLQAAYPGRFLIWAGVNVDGGTDAALKQIRRLEGSPVIKGISIEPTLSAGYVHAADEKLFPIYELCANLGLPVNVTLSAPLQLASPEPMEKMHPHHLVKVAKAFPRLSIHVGHAAWPLNREMIAVAVSCPNIWVSPDQYLISKFPGSEDFAKAALHLLPRRVLFGSCYPFKPLKESVNAYKAWGFPAALQEAIFRGNAQRLMNL